MARLPSSPNYRQTHATHQSTSKPTTSTTLTTHQPHPPTLSPDEYWSLVMDIARRNSLKRVVRCSQIMGRAESDDLSAAQIMYPVMQCADVFFLKVT